MKKYILIALAAVVLGGGAYVAYSIISSPAQSPKDKASYTGEGLDIDVVYFRPFKKGRLIFGDASDKALVPYGQYWRLGANDATEITFSRDVIFGGQPVAAGSYRMYAVPGPGTWQVSLNSELGQFGYMEPNYALDVAKVEVSAEDNAGETEQFTIRFERTDRGAQMYFVWDKTQVAVPITIAEEQ